MLAVSLAGLSGTAAAGPVPAAGHSALAEADDPADTTAPAEPVPTFETVGDPVTLVPGEEGTVFATCPGRSVLVSGGYLMSGSMQVLLTSRAATPNTWTVTVLNDSRTNATVAAVAQCAP
ncbi:hypothetical protein ACFVZ8_15655 [Streptomyces sp. NPDC059558]|uniref:hypothetical protein n=1 Tax=unclassified Streptomyces TaxID=2593676 RepID=UPI0009C3B636|nr:hypothetical protein [Streptomyces sp. Sge12]ARE73252.1 hypothetical protein B6R96_04310 [Streptomyces sp. Sge12]